jgi:hypothetical protein
MTRRRFTVKEYAKTGYAEIELKVADLLGDD